MIQQIVSRHNGQVNVWKFSAYCKFGTIDVTLMSRRLLAFAGKDAAAEIQSLWIFGSAGLLAQEDMLERQMEEFCIEPLLREFAVPVNVQLTSQTNLHLSHTCQLWHDWLPCTTLPDDGSCQCFLDASHEDCFEDLSYPCEPDDLHRRELHVRQPQGDTHAQKDDACLLAKEVLRWVAKASAQG